MPCWRLFYPARLPFVHTDDFLNFSFRFVFPVCDLLISFCGVGLKAELFRIGRPRYRRLRFAGHGPGLGPLLLAPQKFPFAFLISARMRPPFVGPPSFLPLDQAFHGGSPYTRCFCWIWSIAKLPANSPPRRSVRPRAPPTARSVFNSYPPKPHFYSPSSRLAAPLARFQRDSIE